MNSQPVRDFQWGWPERVALAIYSILVFVTAYFHEPWADEAQAWLIARDCSLKEIIFTRMHYEGTPALWHVLLWTLTRLHVSYFGMHLLNACLGVFAAWLVLRYAPFPRWVKLLIPFGYCLLYLGPIVARSHFLGLILTLLVCIELRKAAECRHGRVFFCLALMANVSLHAFACALSLLAYYLLTRAGHTHHYTRRRWGVAVVSAAMVFALITAFPARDSAFGPGRALYKSSLMTRLIGPAPRSAEEDSSWAAEAIGRGSTSPAEKSPAPAHVSLSLLMAAYAYEYGSYLLFVISPLGLVSLVFVLLCMIWCHHRGHLAKLVVILLPFAIDVVFPIEAHLQMLLWVPVLAALWLLWPANGPVEMDWHEYGALAAVGVVFIVQACSGIYAVNFDIRNPFDPSPSAVTFLRRRAETRNIVAFGVSSTAMQPYFTASPFLNHPTSYWTWSVYDTGDADLRVILGQRPPIVLYAYRENNVGVILNTLLHIRDSRFPDPFAFRAEEITAAGYHETQRFCGEHPTGFSYSELQCISVYERSNSERSGFGSGGSSAQAGP